MEGPDDQVEGWFVRGSPMGILERPANRDIFPLYDDLEAANNPNTLPSEETGYRSRAAENDKDAKKEIQNMVDRKWIEMHSSKWKAKRRMRGN